jgi:hypothetical protein
MLKNISKLEFTINNKAYQFICDSDSPLTDVKEFLFQCLKHIGQIEDEVRKQQDKKAEDESKIEELKQDEVQDAIG